MDFESKKHKFQNYFYLIELAPKHEMFQYMSESFSMLPNGDYAMFTSGKFVMYEEALDTLKETLTGTLRHLINCSGVKSKLLWERNDFTDEERADHSSTLIDFQWLDTELMRFYGVVSEKEFTGDEWFLRARLMYKDEGGYIFDVPSSIQ
jgi:hypothetical protein